MSGKINISTEGSESLIMVAGNFKVLFADYISLSRGGAEIGSIDAEYDFSNLLPEYHGLALTAIQRHGLNICMPSLKELSETKQEERKESFGKTFLRFLFSWRLFK